MTAKSNPPGLGPGVERGHCGSGEIPMKFRVQVIKAIKQTSRLTGAQDYT